MAGVFCLPSADVLAAAERLVVDFGDPAELHDRLQLADRALAIDNRKTWQALQAQGIFRGSGAPRGKIAFLFPGQGSQYVNMGRELVARFPVVRKVFDDADAVMTPILGRPLDELRFCRQRRQRRHERRPVQPAANGDHPAGDAHHGHRHAGPPGARLGAWFGAVPHTRPLRVSMSLGAGQVDPKTRREIQRATRYEGPTSIMSLLGGLLETRGIENNSLMLQLPHYVQLEDDHTAAAAMLEAAGEAFGLSTEVAETVTGMRARGERQYERIDRMVGADPELKQAVESFERAYDQEQGKREPDGPALNSKF